MIEGPCRDINIILVAHQAHHKLLLLWMWQWWDFSVISPHLLQEDSGGPLMCSHKNKYTLVGIISSGKGWVEIMMMMEYSDICNNVFRCGSYPGLYTDVARYVDWIIRMTNLLENEIEWETSCLAFVVEIDGQTKALDTVESVAHSLETMTWRKMWS